MPDHSSRKRPSADARIPFVVENLSEQRPFADLESAAPVDDMNHMLGGFRATREAGLTFEKAVGQYVTISASLLQLLSDKRRAVARIATSGLDFEGIPSDWLGTGFLVSDNLLLTNHHVLNSADVARSARVEFDYEIAPKSLLAGQTIIAASRKTFQLAPERLFITSPVNGGLDYSFVWIDRTASTEFGQIPLERSSFTVRKGEQAFVIHHPDGRPKEASLDDTDIVGLDSKVIHYASDTEGGSSGAPIFDRQGRLIALHHASRAMDATFSDGQTTSIVNEGIKIAAIALDLELRSQGEGADAAMAREVLSAIRGSDSLTGFFGALGRKAPAGTPVEKVVGTYRGSEADIDVGFWNIEHLASRWDDDTKLNGASTVIADMMLDVWGLSEVSPNAIRALVDRLRDRFGQDYDYALSEPDSSDGKQSTAVIWRRATLEGRIVDWPEEVRPLFRLNSNDPDAPEVEAVHGRIFDRYPGLFELRTRAASGTPSLVFHIVPLHLKAMSEGSLRRRMASAILRRALVALKLQGVTDVIVGGDVNAPLASGDFDALTEGGYAAMGAQDEAEGSITYVKGPKSLIDNIFLSPNLARTVGADDFMIVAKDRSMGDYIRTISDHRPIMMRLSLARIGAAAPLAGETVDAILDRLVRAERLEPEVDGAGRVPGAAARYPDRITYEELKRLMRDPSIPDGEIARYLKLVDEGKGPFRVQVEPDPHRVVMDDAARFEVESALAWGNGISRWRRRQRFEWRLAQGERKPVLVSEGDSWFQFPFFIEDVIDHLNRDFLICSLDAAGDTADNMLNRDAEYMQALVEQKANGVAGFLLSAAGNDVIGVDETGVAALTRLLTDFKPGRGAAAHIVRSELRKTLGSLEGAYRSVVETIRADPDFQRLPIFIHGYDYAIPGGFPGDVRRPSWAAVDKWLGSPMRAKGITDPELQRAIIRILIDELYGMLSKVAGDSAATRVFVVNARGALGPVENWADEIHGTSDGFVSVAARFKSKISSVLAGP